ncbi:nuclear transport factor 2 family protein [Nocardia yamanashiensis]|uniref:nuclear transport factor 2 family protein n=1 Tax=Nocardia yamanashiensis TaxID=209247 RepID=UPI001E3C9F9A|nr:nuclear transport factor 2 family protein [Nocardia yamanashiensis]UGT39703.1 nuclear transport factor 2 family protein [Nocardia yamanashiensis]
MTTAQQNKALIRAVFDDLSAGRTAALPEAMSDDVRWTFAGNWSWSGTWSLKPTVLHQLLGPLMAQFDGGYRIHADLIIAEDDRVVVQAQGNGTTVEGDPYNQTYCFIFTLADGRITEVIEHCDTALVERVLRPLTPVNP